MNHLKLPPLETVANEKVTDVNVLRVRGSSGVAGQTNSSDNAILVNKSAPHVTVRKKKNSRGIA